jgi:membrane protein DedA with SNARE-associated domain
VRNYLITISRRFFRWIIAAVVAVLFYGAATLIGLSQTLVLIVAFIGALAGSVLAYRLTERLFGPEPQPAPPPPRGRGTGRRGA